MNIYSNLVYHVSYMKVEFPVIRKHKFTKDFSWGFYCTTSKEEAEKSAIKLIPPIINVYKINYLNSLNIKKFEDYNDEWLDFVISCHSGGIHSYDVVIGPMATDTIYDYMIAYNNGQLNKQNFYDLIKSNYPAYQISFHTIKALDCINFIESYQL